METEQTFTRGPILSTLLKFALPVLLALLLQAMYGAVDLQVVGKFGTAADISAVSTGSQIMQTVTIVITGLAMGITVLLGQKIGEDSHRRLCHIQLLRRPGEALLGADGGKDLEMPQRHGTPPYS